MLATSGGRAHANATAYLRQATLPGIARHLAYLRPARAVRLGRAHERFAQVSGHGLLWHPERAPDPDRLKLA